eukprot:scaffold176222_cov29-Tisochrysis_lutea.AAC.4
MVLRSAFPWHVDRLVDATVHGKRVGGLCARGGGRQLGRLEHASSRRVRNTRARRDTVVLCRAAAISIAKASLVASSAVPCGRRHLRSSLSSLRSSLSGLADQANHRCRIICPRSCRRCRRCRAERWRSDHQPHAARACADAATGANKGLNSGSVLAARAAVMLSGSSDTRTVDHAGG